MRVLTLVFALVPFVFLTAGCGDLDKKAEEAKKKAEDAKKGMDKKAEEAKKEVEKKAEEGKLAFLKPITDAFPEIEKKIQALSGEKKTEATTAFEGLKRLIEEFKKASPEKWEGLKQGVTAKFNELKKMLGL